MSTSLRERVAARPWFHTIDLGGGVVTPGLDDSPRKLAALGLPKDLAGKSVLDVGAWNGFFSFEAERRGASRVVASDGVCWRGPSEFYDKAQFDLAKEALNSKVEECPRLVEELNAEDLGQFDIVLFLGVLYHATDPLGYLRKMRSLCKGFVIIETYVDMLHIKRPALAYYPGATLNGDASNFFGPNESAVIAMCEDAGFSRTIVVDRKWHKNRMVFHAHA